MNKRMLAGVLLAVGLLLAACGHEVTLPDHKGALPEDVNDDNVEIEDTAVAYVEPDGKWRMVQVNRENSKYLQTQKTGDEVYHAPRRFDAHLRDYHRYCDRKIILNRDMRDLVEFLRQQGFFDHATEIDEKQLLPGKWDRGSAIVVEQGGKLYRLSKPPKGRGDPVPLRRYSNIKTQMLRISLNYRHYEVKRNVSPSSLQPTEPLIKPKYRDQLKKQEQEK